MAFKLIDKEGEEYTMAAEQHVAGLRVAPNDSGILVFQHKETGAKVQVHRIDGQGWLDNEDYELVGGTPKAAAPATQLHQETAKQKQARVALEARVKELEEQSLKREELISQLNLKIQGLEASAQPGGQDALVEQLQAELATVKGILTEAQVKKLAKAAPAAPAEGGQ